MTRIGRAWPAMLGAVALLVTAAPLLAQDKDLIAVLDFRPVGASEVEASAVTDRVREELLRTGRFKLVDRSQMEAVLNEQALQQTGCTEQECAVQVGQILGVRQIVAGKLTKISPELWQLSALVVDVETAETTRAESIQHQGNFFGLLTAQVPPLAAKLAGAPGRRATVEAAPAAPPPAAAEPESPPPDDSRPRWSMWAGWGLVGLGVLAQAGAQATNTDAELLAQEARDNNNPATYEEAQALRDEAEQKQARAIVIGAAGVGLLYYYYFTDGGSLFSRAGDLPSGPLLALDHAAVGAGWRWRW